MFQITSFFEQLPQPAYAAELLEQTIKLHQNEAFFRLACEKELRRNRLIEIFSGKLPAAIKISNHFSRLNPVSSIVGYEYLEYGFFADSDSQQFSEKCAGLHHCLVIVCSNDIVWNASSFVNYYNACPNTVFIIWDWDNHHALGLSRILATHSDIYIPAHMDNYYVLSRYNSNISNISVGVAQWTSIFLINHRDEMVRAERSDMPLGMHVPYDYFEYRLKVLLTLQSVYPSIGPSLHYHSRSDEDRLKEWVGHKLHFIAPVLNDVPLRLFDALASGGIPLIPDSLRFNYLLRDAHPDDFLCYSARDILSLKSIVAKGCDLFDYHGEAGIRRRAEYALQCHHGDERLGKILDDTSRRYGFIWRQ